MATYATNITLMEDIKQGSRWEEFLERYAPVIRGFCRNAGVRRHEVDDVVQEVFARFLKVADRFTYDPARGRFRGYLKTITLNVIRQGYRAYRPGVGVDSSVINDVASPPTLLWDAEWNRRLAERAIEEARAHFEPTTFNAFELYGVRGVPAEEVARRLGISQESVRSAKSRVSTRVRKSFARMRDEEG